MKKLIALVATLMLTVGLIMVAVPQALAGHQVTCAPAKFSLEVAPTTAEEGGSVRITVRADTPSRPGSSVYIETVDETAKTGKDYTGIPRQEVHSGGGSWSFQFTVPITNDPAAEPAETFRVRLSDPQTGYACEEQPEVFGTPGADATGVVPEPVTVTIAANDAASTPPVTSPAPKTSPSPSGSTPPATSVTSKNSPSPGQSPAPSGSSQSTSSSPAPIDTAGLDLESKPPPNATDVEQIGEDLPVALGPGESESPSPLIRAQGKSGGGNKAATIVFITVLAAAGAGFGLWKLRRT